MSRILISTGALIGRPNGRDYTLLQELCPRLECDGLEFLMYDTWFEKINHLKSFLPSLPVKIHTFHLEKQIGELISYGKLNEALYKMEKNCELASVTEAKTLILHLWNGIISDKNIDYNIECYKYLEEIASSHGLILTVENVVCSQRDPFTNLSSLLEHYPHIQFTFDTKMADFHKQIDLLYTQYSHLYPHITHLHINDRRGDYMDWSNLRVLHPGRGTIDFDKFFSFILSQGYIGAFTTEATSFDQTGKIDVSSLNQTVSFIREMIAKYTKG